MTEGENKKGFAGLSSLESSVNPIVSDPVSEKPSQEVKTESERQVKSKPTPPPPISEVTPKYTYSPEMDFIKKYWLWIAIGIFVIWAWASSENKSTSTSTGTGSSNYSYSSNNLTETLPPYGSGAGHTLNASEIYYCLAEAVRIDANRSTVNKYDDFSVDKFNRKIEDYNGRCGDYRYKPSAKSAAITALAANWYSIEAQGRARL
jgi:hypothetical protein